jgi:hypothetical protein
MTSTGPKIRTRYRLIDADTHVGRHLVRPVEGDERCDGDQAAIALGQTWSLPHVADSTSSVSSTSFGAL